jgi:mono/diheme cytochrome c family protein
MRDLVVRAAAFFCALAVSACQRQSALEPAPLDQQSDGKAIADTQCAACHAVGAKGASPRPEAPPFRDMAQRYQLNMLQEELDNGLSAGHPPMQRFKLSVRGADALMAYLRAIQTPPAITEPKPGEPTAR